MVPVASTTSWMSPRSTLAVKCCGWALRFNPKTTNAPAKTTRPATMYHLLFVFILFPETRDPAGSFVSQCFDRIQQRCLSRRVIPKKHANSNREDSSNHDGLKRHLHGPMKRLAHEIGTYNSEQHPSRTAHQAEHD